MNILRKPGVRAKYIGRKISENFKQHLSDSTAVVFSLAPIWTAFDTSIGMEDEVSIAAKANVALITYAGSGWLYGKLRDVSKKTFKITDKTRERTQGVHDFLYNAAYTSALTTAVYSLSNEPDWKKIAGAVGFAAGTSMIRGPIAGYAIDAFRDLFSIKENNRTSYPDLIKNQKAKTKKWIAGGLMAASIGIQAGIYSITPDKIEWSQDTETRQVENTGGLEKSIGE